MQVWATSREVMHSTFGRQKENIRPRRFTCCGNDECIADPLCQERLELASPGGKWKANIYVGDLSRYDRIHCVDVVHVAEQETCDGAFGLVVQ